MARDVASITITGRLGHEPELRYTPDGKAVTNFSLAVNRGTREKQVTDWYRVTCFGATAEFVTGYLAKGRKVLVLGRQELQEWEGREGKRRDVVVIASEVAPMDSRGTAHGQGVDTVEEVDQFPDGDLPF